MSTHRWMATAAVLIAAAALPAAPGGVTPAEAGQRPVTCVTFALPAATPSGALAPVGPGPSGATPTAVSSIVRGIVPPAGAAGPLPVIQSITPGASPHPLPSVVAPIGSVAPAVTIPGVLLLPPVPATGAYVVPVTTTLPSAPGVSLTRLEVLIPPTPAPGQSRSAVATGLVQGALGPAGSMTPLVVCY